LNAANEVAVDFFLKNEIRFTQISELVERVMNQTKARDKLSLDSILEADKMARQDALIIVKGLN
jgi:1-deoxy-D-xylulose-5-phosphate reductoisomerase